MNIVANDGKPYFSLITGTVGKFGALEKLLESLSLQSERSIELILIDQSADGVPQTLLEGMPFKVIYRREKPGLSHARNTGLALAQGEIAAFPDDDCTYPAGLLENIRRFFTENPGIAGCSTVVTDALGRHSAGGYMASKEQLISRNNVWRTAVSPSLFFRRSEIADLKFDETLGLGAGTSWGSGEETDFLLQLLARHKEVKYLPQFCVCHDLYSGPWIYERGWKYGCGCGAVLKKHRYSVFRAIRMTFWQICRAVQALTLFKLRKALFHASMAAGRIYAFFARKGI